jgi:hypothetical protein
LVFRRFPPVEITLNDLGGTARVDIIWEFGSGNRLVLHYEFIQDRPEQVSASLDIDGWSLDLDSD